MTLNNNRQDASNMRQCVAYDLFREAGLIAPRCNFAKVTVNGENLGVYSNVEPIKNPFLKLNFNDDDGNLYEAQVSDFGGFSNNKFEKKNNKSANDRSDLQAISDALALPDDEMLAALTPLINIEYFIKFWAMETLVGAWDSATGNANNYYIYRSPEDNLFYFIPWGADTALSGAHTLKPATGSLYRNFRLASRLYAIDSYRAQYFTTIEGYLGGLWTEQNLLSKIENIAILTATSESAIDPVIQFISGKGLPTDANYIPSQRERLQAAMESRELEKPEFLQTDTRPDCTAPLTTNLTARVNSNNGVDSGSFNFALDDGQLVNANMSVASIELDSLVYSVNSESSPSVISLLLIGADLNDTFKPYVLQVFIEAPEYTFGEHSLHGVVTNLLLFTVDTEESLGISTLALGATGTITINSIGVNDAAGDINLTIDAIMEFSGNIE
jgi:hypothetical protein